MATASIRLLQINLITVRVNYTNQATRIGFYRGQLGSNIPVYDIKGETIIESTYSLTRKTITRYNDGKSTPDTCYVGGKEQWS